MVADACDGLAAAVLGTFDGRGGWVNGLAAQPNRRGHGHLSAVLAELERRLVARGCRKVNLLIEPDNGRVTGFYRQQGYTEDPLILMEKWLTPGASAGRQHSPGQLTASLVCYGIAKWQSQGAKPRTAGRAVTRGRELASSCARP